MHIHDLGVTSHAGRSAGPRTVHAWIATLLVLALLWAQMLGLAHGVRHFHAPHAHAAHDSKASHAHVAHAPAAPQNLLEHLAVPDGEAQEQECRLYDQLGQGGPIVLSLIATLTQASPLTPAWVVLQALQPRPCVAFAARAPPASR
ncbi:hypothetical protein DW355_07325 [Hylemonella gracilis]|jgi:hypothetical protein|uniref:DUF2946 domain-containing protein n=1 Tax=Hylemonella gracilis TaxID=80880 RepID=A0A4P6UKH2_9BURK|nr:hypothetical protein [Hylemonella gracilis]QBK04615.1 hypothetical protein DW355_07325 [Hylemonella gracilis]